MRAILCHYIQTTTEGGKAMGANDVLRFNVQTEMEKERADKRIVSYAKAYAEALKTQKNEKKD